VSERTNWYVAENNRLRARVAALEAALADADDDLCEILDATTGWTRSLKPAERVAFIEAQANKTREKIAASLSAAAEAKDET
jgi:hypothetical protein